MSPDAPARLTVPADNAFTLAACAEMIFTDRPFLERVEAIASRDMWIAQERGKQSGIW